MERCKKRELYALNRQNNFDLLRLFAALQVVYFHAMEHLHLGSHDSSLFNKIFAQFPGVPIFFVISGFLITDSYLRNRQTVGQYLRNRALRIFRALIVCTCLTTLMLGLLGFLPADWRVGAWFVGQITVLPIYNPVFLRDFGVGDPNGALWTIPVEMQFYLFIPIVFALMYGVLGEKKRSHLLALTGALLVSFGVYTWFMAADRTPLWMQVFYITIFPHLWLFLLGACAQVGWQWVQPFIQGKVVYWLVFYAAICMAKAYTPIGDLGVLLAHVGLAGCVLSAAFSLPWLAHKLLGKTDISYGVYLYHMPVMNLFVELGKTGSWLSMVAVTGLSVILAGASWAFIEKPALSLKKRKTAFAPVSALR
ncbi:MAG: acyltransferase family protein [Proteobacteria bacterium]|nr:acyltransferase family protein [Pseudomonadota bacterium]